MKNTTIEKIEELLRQRGWSLYRLAKEAELPYSSLNNLFQRNTEPTLPTLRSICGGFGISLSEFFADEPTPVRCDYTAAELALIEEYRALKKSDRRLLESYIAGLSKRLPEP